MRPRKKPPARPPASPNPPSEELALVAGTTRSGKTHGVAERVRAEPRLFVWGVKADFSRFYGCTGTNDPRALHAAALSSAPVRLEYTAPATSDHFEAWCRLAWVWLRVNARAGHSVAL